MCKKQQYLQLYNISTRVFFFYTIPRSVENEGPPKNHLETAGTSFNDF